MDFRLTELAFLHDTAPIVDEIKRLGDRLILPAQLVAIDEEALVVDHRQAVASRDSELLPVVANLYRVPLQEVY